MAYLALRTRRGGWAGIFLGFWTEVALWGFLPDSDGMPALGGAALVAGVAAFGLPTIDAMVAIVLALAFACAMLGVPGFGHSIIPFIAAAPALGFALGALLALAKNGMARFRLSRSPRSQQPL